MICQGATLTLELYGYGSFPSSPDCGSADNLDAAWSLDFAAKMSVAARFTRARAVPSGTSSAETFGARVARIREASRQFTAWPSLQTGPWHHGQGCSYPGILP